MDRSLIGSISILHKIGNFCATFASVGDGLLACRTEACTGLLYSLNVRALSQYERYRDKIPPSSARAKRLVISAMARRECNMCLMTIWSDSCSPYL